MTKSAEQQPVAVPETAKRAGEILRRWCWVEPTVWTERMLTALDEGVKGGQWFSLIDKVHTERTLRAAFHQVASKQGAAGVDHVTIAMYQDCLDENLTNLGEELCKGTYRPQPIRRHYIPKPGSQEKRPLGIPTVRDRVVQTALRMVLEPIFEREFAERSYGFRPHRGCKDALRRVEELLKAGYTHVVDADWATSLKKTISWRVVAAVADIVVAYAFTGSVVLSGALEHRDSLGNHGHLVAPVKDRSLPPGQPVDLPGNFRFRVPHEGRHHDGVVDDQEEVQMI